MIMIIIFRTVHASISDSSGKEMINSVKLKSKITIARYSTPIQGISCITEKMLPVKRVGVSKRDVGLSSSLLNFDLFFASLLQEPV